MKKNQFFSGVLTWSMVVMLSSAGQAYGQSPKTSIESLRSDLDAEISARTAGDSSLSAGISEVAGTLSAENAARLQADNSLRNDLNTEINARITGYNGLSASISGVAGTLSTEATTRGQADAQLQNNLNVERSQRMGADSYLQSQISQLFGSISQSSGTKSLYDSSGTLIGPVIGYDATSASALVVIQADGNNLLMRATKQKLFTSRSDSYTFMGNWQDGSTCDANAEPFFPIQYATTLVNPEEDAFFLQTFPVPYTKGSVYIRNWDFSTMKTYVPNNDLTAWASYSSYDGSVTSNYTCYATPTFSNNTYLRQTLIRFDLPQFVPPFEIR